MNDRRSIPDYAAIVDGSNLEQELPRNCQGVFTFLKKR